MNPVSPKISFRSCPSCGAALNSGAMTCHSCGGLVMVEGIFRRLKTEIRYQVNRISESLKDRQTLLWTLALCPIVILPPILALFMSFRSPNAAEEAAHGAARSPDVLIMMVAVCNIILSIMFWRWIGDTVVSMGLSIGLILKSIGVSHPGSLRSI